ncbi:MAG: choice-of-anchor J domain-containing protein [Marinilabiliaceae bacterium]|nr:choice-of-anchor J domain-containing protein [Marinilabiliaceae bacterium]
MIKKYILPSMMALAVLATSCDYNEDNFEGFNDLAQPSDIKTIDYILADADYAVVATNSTNKALAEAAGVTTELSNLKTTKLFSATLPASTYLPAILKNTYRTADDGSTVKVTYNYNQGRAADVANYEKTVRTLTAEDYKSVNATVGLAKSFFPAEAPGTHLPVILKNVYPNAVKNDICLVYYNNTTNDPESGYATMWEETFDNEENITFNTFSLEGDKAWGASYYNPDYFMKMSGYQQVNNDWLISPAIDLSPMTSPALKVRQTAKYVNGQWDQITINISTDFDANNPASATWTTLTPTTKPTGSDYVFVETENLDLSAWQGQKIYIGFHYQSDLANAATWEIDHVKVLSLGVTATGVSEQGAYYQYSGSKWAPMTNAYALSVDDYLAMGITNKNFSSSMTPANYFPQFLSSKYPYAQEGNKMMIGYKYYSSSTKTVTYLADAYTFTSGKWSKNNETTTITDKFVRANGVWVYNPSVVLSLMPVKNDPISTAYYQAATDWVWENIDKAQLGISAKGQGYVSSYGNNELYAGTSAYYNNIDMRPSAARTQYAAGYEGKSDAEVTTMMTERLRTVMAHALTKMNPDAEPIEGVEITYTLKVAIYTGNSVTAPTHTMVYKVIGKGQFEWMSGPTAIQ